MKKNIFTVLSSGVILVIFFLSGSHVAYSESSSLDASQINEYPVMPRGDTKIIIDAYFDDWNIKSKKGSTGPTIFTLVMGEKTWIPWQGGTWDNPEDLSATLQILYDTDNLYFALKVTDNEYVAQGEYPWHNDGVNMAINGISTQHPPAPGMTPDTHLYEFSIKDGWMIESGHHKGAAEIKSRRDDVAKQNLFEWRMPISIFAPANTVLQEGKKVAIAFMINDSDLNAPGQKGWIGWGTHALYSPRFPEDMKTLVMSKPTQATK